METIIYHHIVAHIVVCIVISHGIVISLVVKPTYYELIEGSLGVKLPTIWTDGKAEVGRAEERRSEKE